MIKKFLSLFIALILLFVSQSPVFSATKEVDKTQKNMVYTYTINTQTVFNEESKAPYQNVSSESNNNFNDYAWIASIFIAGLGQILMGDIEGGIWWMIKVYALPIIFGILCFIITSIYVNTITTSQPIKGMSEFGLIYLLIFKVVYIVSLFFYIMNIIDAYTMSKNKSSAVEMQSKLLELQNIAKIAENISIKDDNVSYKVLTF